MVPVRTNAGHVPKVATTCLRETPWDNGGLRGCWLGYSQGPHHLGVPILMSVKKC